ncbi:UbiA prenyltransferase family protein [Thermococcus sp.]
MLRAILRNTRIGDGRSFIGMGLLGLAMNIRNLPDFKNVSIVLISLVLYVAYAFSINNCFDVDTDVLNPKKRSKNPIASGELSFRAGVIFSMMLALLGVSFASLLSREEIMIYISMLLLATLYSAPPRLKAQPFLDVISHGMFFGAMPFFYGACSDGILTKYEILIGFAILTYSFAMELRNHLEDYESDLEAGLRTTPIIMGREMSERLVMAFSGISIAILLMSFSMPFGALGGMIAGVRVNYRTLDWVVTFLLTLHVVKTLLGA